MNGIENVVNYIWRKGDTSLMFFELADVLTIDIDDRFPWLEDWKTYLGIREIEDESSINNPDIVVRSICSRKPVFYLPRRKCDYQPSNNALIDRKHKCEINIDNQITLWAGSPCLEWSAWIIQIALLKKRATFIHGASVAGAKGAAILQAPGGTGKTTIIGLLAKRGYVKVMGDDYVILGEDGTCFPYHRPVVLYPYHKNVFKDTFEKGIKPSVAANMKNKIIIKVLKESLRPFPTILQAARRFNPFSKRARLIDVFGEEAVSNRKEKLRIVLTIEKRTDIDEIMLERTEISPIERSFNITYGDFDEYCTRLINNAIDVWKLEGLSKIYGTWEEILKRSMNDIEHYTVKVPLKTNYYELTELLGMLIEAQL